MTFDNEVEIKTGKGIKERKKTKMGVDNLKEKRKMGVGN